jgi:protein arginine kinase activator
MEVIIMKCQNCGRKEINFHYSSNINGCVTETHLCSECAAKSGYDIEQLFDTGSIFDRFFPIINGRGGFLPVTIPLMGYNMVSPFALRPYTGRRIKASTCDCGLETKTEEKTTEAQTANVDDDMRKRRELYAQMRAAADNEEFEKAAGIRDEIRKLES